MNAPRDKDPYTGADVPAMREPTPPKPPSLDPLAEAVGRAAALPPLREVARVEMSPRDVERFGFAVADGDLGKLAAVYSQYYPVGHQKAQDLMDDVIYLWETRGRPHGSRGGQKCECDECASYDRWARRQEEAV